MLLLLPFEEIFSTSPVESIAVDLVADGPDKLLRMKKRSRVTARQSGGSLVESRSSGHKKH